MKNPYTQLMEKAWNHARAHGAVHRPALFPYEETVLCGEVPLGELQAEGVRVVPWTVNSTERMRALLLMEVDGIISDRPDLLQQVLKQERDTRRFDVAGHRGARGLRPENTLPAFEAGLDALCASLETDIGVTADGVPLLSHDQFLSPESCRRVDGLPYTLADKVYVRDISCADAQRMFVCDRLHFGPEQRNDLSLSPVSDAFAAQEGLISPYSVVHLEKLFRFVGFYEDYYGCGAGTGHPQAAERAANARRVRFKVETKILPENISIPEDIRDPHHDANHTAEPQEFVDALYGAVVRSRMQSRVEVLSFDFRTLLLLQEQHPEIAACYLTGNGKMLSSEFVPEPLRAAE
ncbi:MAG: glycerophosphodiester phosphodiesterase [Acidobacteriaceae bacterium]|nr:glycerophosphodiester phosphodiesterase [Acidobacteriaceae bacterium]